MFDLVIISLLPLVAVVGIYLTNGQKVVERRKVKYLDPTHPEDRDPFWPRPADRFIGRGGSLSKSGSGREQAPDLIEMVQVYSGHSYPAEAA